MNGADWLVHHVALEVLGEGVEPEGANQRVDALLAPSFTTEPNTSAEPGVAWLYDTDDVADAVGTAPLTWAIIQGPPEPSIVEKPRRKVKRRWLLTC